ncbi:hypothetical protein FHR38_001338 [Micromonospora polyrhachis]|uniref:Uncharacterized protein n=1 Tax=Micromonospora polyrhachis TaxID=1282883 RepID=A0A7W7WN90_9ACTN|nr:hypothetical protein [Micromonospora polyrhachis]
MIRQLMMARIRYPQLSSDHQVNAPNRAAARKSELSPIKG